MCRMCIIFPELLREMHANNDWKWFPDYLRQLDASAGGDGWGIAAPTKDGEVFLRKGISLTPDEVTETIKTLDPDALEGPVFIHTRSVSTGRKCNELCHPFVGERFVLMHNGTLYNHRDYLVQLVIAQGGATLPAERSDTWVLHQLFEWVGETFLQLVPVHRVVAYWDREKKQTAVAVHPKAPDLDWVQFRRKVWNHWMYASEVPLCIEAEAEGDVVKESWCILKGGIKYSDHNLEAGRNPFDIARAKKAQKAAAKNRVYHTTEVTGGAENTKTLAPRTGGMVTKKTGQVLGPTTLQNLIVELLDPESHWVDCGWGKEAQKWPDQVGLAVAPWAVGAAVFHDAQDRGGFLVTEDRVGINYDHIPYILARLVPLKKDVVELWDLPKRQAIFFETGPAAPKTLYRDQRWLTLLDPTWSDAGGRRYIVVRLKKGSPLIPLIGGRRLVVQEVDSNGCVMFTRFKMPEAEDIVMPATLTVGYRNELAKKLGAVESEGIYTLVETLVVTGDILDLWQELGLVLSRVNKGIRTLTRPLSTISSETLGRMYVADELTTSLLTENDWDLPTGDLALWAKQIEIARSKFVPKINTPTKEEARTGAALCLLSEDGKALDYPVYRQVALPHATSLLPLEGCQDVSGEYTIRNKLSLLMVDLDGRLWVDPLRSGGKLNVPVLVAESLQEAAEAGIAFATTDNTLYARTNAMMLEGVPYFVPLVNVLDRNRRSVLQKTGDHLWILSIIVNGDVKTVKLKDEGGTFILGPHLAKYGVGYVPPPIIERKEMKND